MYKRRLLILLALALWVLMILPIVYLVYGISFFPILGKATFTFFSFVTSKYADGLFTTTIEYALLSAAVAVLLALVYAWIVGRSNVPGKRILELLPILGLSLPLIVKAYAYIILFNPVSGIINAVLKDLFGSFAPVFDIYSFLGMILLTGLGAVPFSYLVILPAIKSIDSSLEEASRIAGRGNITTFLRVTVPLIVPALLPAFILAFIGGMSAFDYALIIGLPAKINVLSTQVYFWVEGVNLPSIGNAAIISIPYVAILIASLAIYLWSTRRTFKYTVVTGKSSGHTPVNLGKMKFVALTFCIAVLLFEFLLPLFAIVLSSVANLVYVHGRLVINAYTFPKYFVQISQFPFFYSAIKQTIEMGLLAAFASTLIAFIMSYTALRVKSRFARVTEYATSVPLALPPIVYGLSLYWMFLLAPGFHLLYNTIWPLVIALVVIRLPFASRLISGNIIQLSNDLEDASQVAGHGMLSTLGRIVGPLTRNSLVYSFVYVFVDSLRELGAVILLVTPTVTTFTAFLLSAYLGHNGGIGVLAAGSVVLTAIVGICLMLLSVVQKLAGRPLSRRTGKTVQPVELIS